MSNFKTAFYILLTANLVMVGLIALLAVRYNWWERIYKKLFPPTLGNTWEVETTKQKMVYAKKSVIVMLGNSITREGEWAELLMRSDVVNRGISGDVLAGFLARVDLIIQLTPEVVFVEGGINDLAADRSPEYVAELYEELLLKLKQKDIRPVVTLTFYVRHATHLNPEVTKLNALLKAVCDKHQIHYIDINPVLAPEQILLPQFTYDGLHLSAEGYAVWRNAILEYLNEYPTKT
jgi:lysophospholipase L1-like esterase